KTVVAAAAINTAIDAGKQAVLMAPTSILAEQHFLTLSELFSNRTLAFLTGRLKGSERQQQLELIAADAEVIIGTHALFQADVTYRDLALVIIDEQHRFGVHQRLKLKRNVTKNDSRPASVMITATPMPGSGAHVAYANVDVSIMDALAPNR